MEQYITASGIAKKCCVSRSTVWRWAKEGVLPSPFKLSNRTTVWRASAIQATLDKLEAEAAS